jgi:transketolase
VVTYALEAAEILAGAGIDAAVANIHTVKPIDESLLRRLAAQTGRILTVEDHGIIGGLGSAVFEALGEVADVVTRRHGVRSYGESGTHADLYARHKLDAQGIAEVAREFIWLDQKAKARA